MISSRIQPLIEFGIFLVFSFANKGGKELKNETYSQSNCSAKRLVIKNCIDTSGDYYITKNAKCTGKFGIFVGFNSRHKYTNFL